MALTLIEGLREARSLPSFGGSSDYALTSYLRDVNTVLSLVSEGDKTVIKSVLANRLQGKALRAVETLMNPTWEQIIAKLREEFGVKESFLGLRNQAMNVVAIGIEELHHKLGEILNLMNTKYSLNPEGNALFSPDMNERLIFDIYINLLSLNIKTLLMQNNIATISGARSYFMENNLMRDVYLRKSSCPNSSRGRDNKNYYDRNQKKVNYGYQNLNGEPRYSNPGNLVRPGNNDRDRRGSGQCGQGGSDQNRDYPVPMEIGNVNMNENFHVPPPDPDYQ